MGSYFDSITSTKGGSVDVKKLIKDIIKLLNPGYLNQVTEEQLDKKILNGEISLNNVSNIALPEKTNTNTRVIMPSYNKTQEIPLIFLLAFEKSVSEVGENIKQLETKSTEIKEMFAKLEICSEKDKDNIEQVLCKMIKEAFKNFSIGKAKTFEERKRINFFISKNAPNNSYGMFTAVIDALDKGLEEVAANIINLFEIEDTRLRGMPRRKGFSDATLNEVRDFKSYVEAQKSMNKEQPLIGIDRAR